MAVSIPVMPYSLPLLPMQNMVKYAEETKKYGLSGALRWEDGEIHSLPQDYADMVGWQELSEIVIKTYNELSNEEKSKCAIFTGNYGQAGAISYYGKKYGLPKIISFSDNFLFWAPDSADSEILIYVNDEVEELLYYFQQVTKVGKLTNIYAIESGVSVYLCRYPRSGFKQYYVNKVKNLKDVYR